MKKCQKNRWKRAAARAAAGILTLAAAAGLTGSGAVSAQAATTISYDNQIIGDNNSSEELYSWIQLKDQDDVDNLFETYSQICQKNGITWDGKNIPIRIIVVDKSGTRKFIQAPGESDSKKVQPSEKGLTSDEIWDQQNTADRDGNIFWMQNYTTMYKDLSFDMSTADGFGDPNFAAAEAIVTRGCGGCFYLEQRDEPIVVNTDRTYTMPYELHTYKEDSGVFSVSDRILTLTRQSSYHHSTDDYCSLLNFLDESSLGDAVHGWMIQQSGSTGNFAVMGYTLVNSYYNRETYLERNQLTYRGASKYRRWTIHQCVPQYRTNSKNQWHDDPSWVSLRDKSNDVEVFEIWYGIPGVAYTALDRVDGDSVDSNYTGTTDAVTESSYTIRKTTVISGADLTVKANSTLGLSPEHAYYVKSSDLMTVEKGGTLIVGRNSLLVVNGKLQNEGDIIVQPGGILMSLDPKISGQSYGNETDLPGTLAGSGNLIVRSGGKIRVMKLSVSGEVHNEGFIDVYKVLEGDNGGSYVSENGAIFVGGSWGLDLINNPASMLATLYSSIWWKTGKTSGASITRYPDGKFRLVADEWQCISAIMLYR